jgi:hypothetical protein
VDNKEKFIATLKGLCDRCKKNPASGPEHTCPYVAELYDEQEYCNCCDDCDHECCMDI